MLSASQTGDPHILSPTSITNIDKNDKKLSAGRAQCSYSSLYGKLDDRWVCCGSLVLKRRQGLTDEQVQNCDGILVDLVPKVDFQIDVKYSPSDWSES